MLKDEAERIIESYRPFAETQDANETVDQETDKLLASLPTGTIANNSDFANRINTGTSDEKFWLVNKDKNGAGVTFVETECGQYYQSYAGDALRCIVLLEMPTFIWREVLKTMVAVRDIERLQEDAKKLGLTLHLYDHTNDTPIPQNPTATIEQKLETEAEIYKQEFEVVVASLPINTVVTNRDFASIKVFATEQQTMWLSKKAEHPSDIVILKVSNLSAISYAGDALRLVAILGTRSLVEGGTLKTHIPMLDLEGVLHKAKKKGFSIKVSDADQTLVLSKAS